MDGWVGIDRDTDVAIDIDISSISSWACVRACVCVGVSTPKCKGPFDMYRQQGALAA